MRSSTKTHPDPRRARRLDAGGRGGRPPHPGATLLGALILGLALLAPLATAHAQGPSLSPIANESVNAGVTRTVNVIAVDVDGRPITLTAALPPFATLNPPTVGTGVVVTTLTLAPTGAHVGDYSAAVTATAGGVPSVRVFMISVNPAGSDQAPIVAAPPLREVTAGVPLRFEVTAGDPDGDAVASLSVTGLPLGATFTPNGTNTAGTFDWTPAAADVGEYDVLFTAENALSGTGVTHVRVAAPPTLAITPIDDVTVEGGSTLSVPVHATGVPGATITLTAALPAFATLDPPGTGTGVVSTTVTVAPPTGSAGTYHASITAISNGTSVTETFDIVVTGAGGDDNRAPILTAPATATVEVGSTLSFDVTATDPDGDHVDLFGSALPPGSDFVDHGDDTGTFTWTPMSGQAGAYAASFSGLDNRGGSGSASTSISVTGGAAENLPPAVSAPPSLQVDEGAVLSFTVAASDPDGDAVALSASGLPEGATFTDHGDDTGGFSWTPGASQAGTYEVAFLGDDGNGGTGSARTTIEVRDADGKGGDDDDDDGGGGVPGRACLDGKWIKPHKSPTCFRVRPVDGSFDVRDVVLASLRLRFQGESIAALGAEVDVCCHKTWPHGASGAGGAEDHALPLDAENFDPGVDVDACGVSCDDRCLGKGHDKGRGKGHDKHGDTCDTLGVRACFSTDALVRLLAGGNPIVAHGAPEWRRLACLLVDAEILATLTNGATVVATFGGGERPPGGHGDDAAGDQGDGGDDQGDQGGQGDDGRDADGKGDDPGDKSGAGSADALSASVTATPNPLSPHTELSFTTARDGRVSVIVYDMQGRRVQTLLDEYRTAGRHTLPWNGRDAWNQRVMSGVYFVRILAPEGHVTRRVSVVK